MRNTRLFFPLLLATALLFSYMLLIQTSSLALAANESSDRAAAGELTPHVLNLSTIISAQLPIGDVLVHGLTYSDGFLWGSTRYPEKNNPVPARIIKIDPDSLSVVDRIILEQGQTDGEDIIAAGGYLWTILFTQPAQLVRIDPGSNPLTYTTAISFTGVNYGAAIDYASGSLWVGLQNHIAQVDISDPHNPTYQLHDYSSLAEEPGSSIFVTALTHDSQYLWASLYQCDSLIPDLSCFTANTIIKADLINPGGSFTHTTLSTFFPDDITFVGKHMIAASEHVPSDLYRFSSDVSTYTATLAFDDPSYGTFTNHLAPNGVWSAFVSSPGTLINFDLEGEKIITLTMPADFNDPAEIVFDEFGNMYVTTWQNRTGIVKYPAPYSTTLSLAQEATDVVLSWSHSSAGITAYQVWRSTRPDFNAWDPDADLLVELKSPFASTMIYTDTVALAGTKYYYSITAQNQYFLYSPPSNRVSGELPSYLPSLYLPLVIMNSE